jgi:uncharacterized protein Veg
MATKTLKISYPYVHILTPKLFQKNTDTMSRRMHQYYDILTQASDAPVPSQLTGKTYTR